MWRCAAYSVESKENLLRSLLTLLTFAEITEFCLGLANLMNFTFWADNNFETILDKQHICGA